MGAHRLGAQLQPGKVCRVVGGQGVENTRALPGRFCSQWRWDPDPDGGRGSWTRLDPPQRVADVYVFCCYRTYPLPDGPDGLDERNSDVIDLENWRFWVASRETLHERFGTNKSVTLGQIRQSKVVAGPLRWSGIPTAVDAALASARQRRLQGEAP